MREKVSTNSRQHKVMLLGLYIKGCGRLCIGVRVVTGCVPCVFIQRVFTF